MQQEPAAPYGAGMAGSELPRYEVIGRTYAAVRRADPRIAAQVQRALGGAAQVVNVGAGTGSYEPTDREVVAVEPSPTMIDQRPPGSAPAVRGVAEALPFPAGCFDAAMAILTIHHWSDLRTGLQELRRVARRQVVFYFEPMVTASFWLLDYFPAIADLPIEAAAPGQRDLEAVLGPIDVEPILVPRDCTDGFGAGYWARPEAYLDPVVQAGISSLALLDADVRAAGTEHLQTDLASGRWDEQHGHLRAQDAFDGGYRLAVAGA